MGRARKATSIRMRLIGSILAVFLLVFLIIAVSFNGLVDNYIHTQALRQLSIAREHVNEDVLMRRPKQPEPPTEFSGTMQQINGAARRATFLSQVESMVVMPDYTLVFPMPITEQPDSGGKDGEGQDTTDIEEKQAVLAVMQAHAVDLTDETMQRLAVSEGIYYFVSIPMIEEQGAPDGTENMNYRIVLYTDMTDVAALSTIINRVLLIILAVTAVLSFGLTLFFSARITRPIRALSQFAEAIGRNDFTPRAFEFHDRELIELLGAMNHAAEQLDAYDREQKMFFQNASHELRTPLMSIKGYAEGIEVGVFEDNAQAAGIIVGEADHLTDLVEDLLYLSKVDNITQGYVETVCDIRELLSNCAQSLHGITLQNGKRIVYDFPDEPVWVTCDEQHLARAFSNILSNGLRYARDSVSVSCRQEESCVCVTIADDGAGINETDLPHLFDRFYKGRGGKHGIGLSIAKAVIQLHHGDIEAHNTTQGAAFTVRIPSR